MTTKTRDVPTEVGLARLYIDRAPRPKATVALCHGAGKGSDSPDLVALARNLPRYDITVFRIEQPWVIAGKRVAPRPEVLDKATIAALDAIRVRTPLVIGGRSAGARTACRLAKKMGAVGCLALAFPLHPPGKPGSSRVDELLGVHLPTLVVQGERDTFGRPDEFPESVDLTAVPYADHGFAVPARAPIDREQALAVVVEAVVEWVTARVG